MSDFNEQAMREIRDGWPNITAQWDALRREHPREDDLIAVIRVEQHSCTLMPRKVFLGQFKPPSGFEHLHRPAGELDPPWPRDKVMWVLCLGDQRQHVTVRVSRDSALSVQVGGT